VVSPGSDEVVSGKVLLQAESNALVEEMYFVVVPAKSTGSRISTIEAQPEDDGVWSANWDSSLVENGDYEIKARAGTETGLDINSEWVLVSIENEVTDEEVELTIVSPSQNAKVHGFVRIIVESAGAVDSVSVVAEGVSNTNNSQRLNASADGTNRWAAVWGTAGVTPGEYSLVAVTTVSDVGEVSERIVVEVVGDDDGTEETADPDAEGSDDEPAQDGSSELILVSPPPGPVKGVLLLLADVKGDAHDIRFVARAHSNGQIVFSRKAAFDSRRGQWVSFWDTEVLVPGDYDLYVSGMNRMGQRLQSLSNTVTKLERLVTPIDEAKPKPLEIVEIPNDAVVYSVTEIPEGTQRPTVPEAEQDTSDADEQLNQECVSAGISPERCELWLAKRYTSFTCRQMGIITKQECLAYLAEMNGGRIPQCSGYDTSECKAYIARMTRGLLDEKKMGEIDEEILPSIGQALVLPPAGEEPGEDSVSEEILGGMPIAGDGQVRVRLHASPGYTKIDEQTSRRSVPAIIFVDSDGDGLPDDAERRIGTDPNSVDTDGDGYNDADEIRNGYNPLGEGRLGEDTDDDRGGLAPVDEAVLSGLPIEQPLHAGKTNDLFTVGVRGFIDDVGTTSDGDNASEEDGMSSGEEDADTQSMVFEGQAASNSVITLFIYSYLPIMLTATTDESGNWSYELDKSLVDGRHEVYVTVTDNTGRVVEKSQPFAFFVSATEAVTEEDFFGVQVVEESPFMAQEEVTRREFNWFILGSVLMAVVVLIVGIAIVARPRKRPELEDEF